ncbi:MAG: HipA family kinase [Candidatus Acidiferrum sp.]
MRGGAQSHLMRCSDGHYYVVKFQNNPQHKRILVNELLGTALAARLGLPTNPAAIVQVSEDMIRLSHELVIEMPRNRIPCQAGLQFGSRYPANPRQSKTLDFLPAQYLRQVVNLRDFAGMLVFDQWTSNMDGRQTVFYQKASDESLARPNPKPMSCEEPYHMAMIDQGFCFNAGEWTFHDSPILGLYANNLVYEKVRGLDDFEPWLTELDELSLDEIFDTAKAIPLEWYESDMESLFRMLRKLHQRKKRIRELLCAVRDSSKHPFPTWVSRGMALSA